MRPIGETLRGVVADLMRKAPREEAAVLAWPLVCGAGVAAHTEAISQAENRLRVVVPDATWKSQLEDFVPQYIRAMRQMTGIQLERIEFEVASGKMPQRRELR